MKKLIFAVISLLLLSGCGVGTYSLSSGKADVAKLSFVDKDSYVVDVKVDNANHYEISTVKQKAYKTNRNIKETSQNVVKLTPGKHLIEVSVAGKSVYTQQIFISAGEHRVVEL